MLFEQFDYFKGVLLDFNIYISFLSIVNTSFIRINGFT